MLEVITPYWVTGAVGSSFWPIAPCGKGGGLSPWNAATAALGGEADLPRYPPLGEPPKGGHFAALGRPETLADASRAFLRLLRWGTA